MTFNISQFSAKINRHGLALNNLFVVRITPPNGMEMDIPRDDLVFFCRSVKIPDYQMNIQTVKRLGFGPNIAYPMYMDNDTLNTEFMIDAEMNILKFFHKWQQLVYNYNSAQGPLASNNRQMVYELGYKKEYCGTIDVDVYSTHSANHIHRYKFYEAWPVSVSHNNLSWQSQNELDISDIVFRYSAFTDEGAVSNVVDVGMGVNLMGYTSAYNTVGSLINTTGVSQFLRDATAIQNSVNNLGSVLRNYF
jgi:hypothetical protein